MLRRGLSWIVIASWLVLFSAQMVLAQCGCEGACTSGCQCGCNDPENTDPPNFDEIQTMSSATVTLLSRLTLAEMGAGQSNVLGNDCWGWTHASSGREFALFGLTNGTAFVEITDPEAPVYIGTLPTAQGNTTWRDMKVYNNRAYIVTDGGDNGAHGVQVFELSRLLNATNFPVTFTADARYTGVGRAHNIAINEDTGFAYVVGSPSHNSSGGLIMLNLKQGVMPVLAGVYAADGYTHDTQVVLYRGPDRPRDGLIIRNPPGVPKRREIAFSANEDTLTIVDVTNKNTPILLSRTPYQQSQYSHQGWLSEDHKYFFMDDELDEQTYGPIPTRTHVWDVRKLSAPVYLGYYNGTQQTIDHNLYVKGNYIFQANYSSGLRILKINNPLTLDLVEVGFFDSYPANNNINFNGAWSCYPYFPSGSIIVSDRQNGLFVVRFTPPN